MKALRIIAAFVLASTLLGTVAQADIQDRINACEQSGDKSCIFNLLREMASRQDRPAKVLPILSSGSYISDTRYYADVVVSGSSIRVSVDNTADVCDFQCQDNGTTCTAPLESRCKTLVILDENNFTQTYKNDIKIKWERRK